MKSTERKHLKENELRTFARQAVHTVSERRGETTVIIAIAAVVGALALGYFGWHEHVQTKALALGREIEAARRRRARRRAASISRPSASAFVCTCSCQPKYPRASAPTTAAIAMMTVVSPRRSLTVWTA